MPIRVLFRSINKNPAFGVLNTPVSLTNHEGTNNINGLTINSLDPLGPRPQKFAQKVVIQVLLQHRDGVPLFENLLVLEIDPGGDHDLLELRTGVNPRKDSLGIYLRNVLQKTVHLSLDIVLTGVDLGFFRA